MWKTGTSEYPHSLISSAAIAAAATLAILFTGCGKAPVRDTGEFEPYVAHFETVAAEHGVQVKVDNLIVRMMDLPNPRERGVCEIRGGQTPTITIDIEAWDTSTDAEREELMFHELGHCVLKRKHHTEMTPSGEPASLMYPIRIDSDTYVKNHRDYLAELFASAAEF